MFDWFNQRSALYTGAKEKAEREQKAQQEHQRSKQELAQTTHTNAGSDSMIRQVKQAHFQAIFNKLDDDKVCFAFYLVLLAQSTLYVDSCCRME